MVAGVGGVAVGAGAGAGAAAAGGGGGDSRSLDQGHPVPSEWCEKKKDLNFNLFYNFG